MRVLLIGGTRFIGPALVEHLLAYGHDVALVHRGRTERDDMPAVPHQHADRADFAKLRAVVDAAHPDAVVDLLANQRGDAEGLVAAVPTGLPLVVLSSQDVYRAFASVRADLVTDACPLDETSPVRTERYPYRHLEAELGEWVRDYEKLDVEEVVLAAGAAVLRLPRVYGERDHRRREEFMLRRVRAGRPRIPIGAGTLLWSKAYVRDVASAIRLAIETGRAAGRIVGLGERRTWPERLYAERILASAGSSAELVTVPDRMLPADLRLTTARAQHLLVDATLARDLLGWRDTDPEPALAASVAWHLAHPPQDESGDFTADDAALAEG